MVGLMPCFQSPSWMTPTTPRSSASSATRGASMSRTPTRKRSATRPAPSSRSSRPRRIATRSSRSPTTWSAAAASLSGRSRARHHPTRWRRGVETPVFALQRPAFFMDHSMMPPAQQGQVRQRRRPTLDPPDQVMPVAPVERPVAACKDTVPVASFERAPGRRRDGPGGMAELVLELALAGDPHDCRIAGIALHRRGRHRATALELARPRAGDPCQGVEAGADDKLPRGARAVLGTAQPIDPTHAALRLAQVQIAPLVRAVGLVERALGIDAVLEVLGHGDELAGGMRL